MDELPAQFVRYPSRAGRLALAARLGLTIDPHSQDWEWTVATPGQFPAWFSAYQTAPLSDDERFSLMEMLVQCVEELSPSEGSRDLVEQLPEWQAVAGLLRERMQLHASTIYYWSVLGHDEPDEQFRISVSMRRLWAELYRVINEQCPEGRTGLAT